MATWSVVCGLAGFVLFAVFVPVGVLGIVLGRLAESRIAASAGTRTGAPLARAGFLLGVISTVLWAVYLAVNVLSGGSG